MNIAPREIHVVYSEIHVVYNEIHPFWVKSTTRRVSEGESYLALADASGCRESRHILRDRQPEIGPRLRGSKWEQVRYKAAKQHSCCKMVLTATAGE